MDLLDLGVIVLIILAVTHGWRRGAVAQLLAFAGFVGGIVAARAIIVIVEPHLRGGSTKTVFALGLIVLLASLMASIGRRLGSVVGSKLARFSTARRLDSGLGSVIATMSTLVVCWLFASVLVETSLTGLSQQIQHSKIISAVEALMPPVPDQFASIDRYLARNGFPQVLVNALPQPTGAIELPDAAMVNQAVHRDASSTVKVVATGCPGIALDGSGFVTSGGLVVTNAHVIAGTSQVTVQLPRASPVLATPILFDPRLDIAVLRPDSTLPARQLTLDPQDSERALPAIVLGYPGGGPLTDGGAAIMSRFVAEGRDIYDTSITYRVVYEIEAIVRPGNSGGPLVAPSGEVLGVVFSRSTTSPTIGYALASPRVLAKVDQALHLTMAVSTDSCVN